MTSCLVLLFGDLSFDFERDLKDLLHVRDNALLTSFFEQVGARIRDEIGCLGARRQSLFPRFTTLVDLVSKLGETTGTPILRFCLLVVCQIGQFISHYSQAGRVYPPALDTYCMGICAGSFAAAAVSSSTSLPELVPHAIEAVAGALRTALASFAAKQDISGEEGKENESWSIVVSGDAMDAWRASERISSDEEKQPYISAVTPNSITLSGPPVALSTFISAHDFKSHELPIHSPYHAPHLFDGNSTETILQTIREPGAQTSQPRIPFISPSSGEVLVQRGFGNLMKQVVVDSLCKIVHWGQMLDSIVAEVGKRDEDCCIVPFCSNAVHLLSMGLNRADITSTVDKPMKPRQSVLHGHFADSKIAVIGYSGRFPDAASNEEFWELLKTGRDVHREIPPDRFNWKTHYDSKGKIKNTSRVKYGCWIKEPGLFDARFFNISPREAENTDPAQRLAITTVYEAMEMAGMVPNRTPSTQQDRIGCFFGTTSDDWREVNSGQNIDTYFIPGGNRAFVPGRISYFFRFSGPSLSMDTACSSSFAAIQTACTYLWRGECDTAIAGGTNILTNPDNFAGLDRGHFLSTTGNCNAFDDAASGYCRADAVGSVILKRLEDAEMDNDPIFGIIAGATTNHCGQTDSITRPHEGDQTSVFKRIIRHAGVKPLDVSYIEMHGTGTQAGDATEMNSVLSVFAPDRGRMPQYPLHLGSAKANIGHAESASGVSSLIKVLMMMKHGEIPPHCGIKTKINHNYPLDLEDRNVCIARHPTPWLRESMPAGKRYSFLNNFSAAGGNTAILLEEAPTRKAEPIPDPRTFHIMTLSAKTAKSLRENIHDVIDTLKKRMKVPISSLSYTTTARRMHHAYRCAVIGNDEDSILRCLDSNIITLEQKSIPPKNKIPDVVFVFTGQGAIYSGLGRDLFKHVSSFREDLLRFNRIAMSHGFGSFVEIIRTNEAEEVSDPVAAQLALTCVQMALSRLWRSWGVNPSLCMGHSLGEYAALFTAGALSASDTIYLVGIRAQLLKTLCKPGTHAMLAVKAPFNIVKNTLQNSEAEIACLNQPDSTVISGKVEEIDRLREAFRMKGHQTTRLDLPFAFHSSQVEPVLEDFMTKANFVTFQPLKIPYISPLLSRVIGTDGTLGVSYLARASREPVNFRGGLEEASRSAIVSEKTIWLEIGSHPICSGMIKSTLGCNSQVVASLRKDTDIWQVIASSLGLLYEAGIDIHWNEYHRDFERCNSVVELPRYSWDLKNYWIMYQNDFCLTKGQGTKEYHPESDIVAEAFKHISPSVQRIVAEEHGSNTSTILVESDVHDPRLTPVFKGHKVNGAELCPSSLYADIAMSLADYMLQQCSESVNQSGIDVCDMKVAKPLVFNSELNKQLFRVSAKANWSDSIVTIAIFSVNENGTKTVDHANCIVNITSSTKWLSEWKRSVYLVQSRIKSLHLAVEHGDAHRLKRGIVYRLFTNIVEFSPQYQGMEEVIMDSTELEAVATVNFKVEDQDFFFNPHWIESLGHVAGFIMNGNESPHPNAEVFINHGWESFKCTGNFQRGKTYHSYSRMQPVQGTLYSGDTYILDGDEIVAMVQGIKFMGVPRKALDGLRPVVKQSESLPRKPPPFSRHSKYLPMKPAMIAESAKEPEPQEVTKGPSDNWLIISTILSEEVGIGLADLMPDTKFTDLGLDSLLALTITSRVREELDLELPSSVFVDYSTVQELRLLCSNSCHESSAETRTNSSVDEESGSSTPTTSIGPDLGTLNLGHIIRSTIADETGVDITDLVPSTHLHDVGVDPLLALTIMGKMSELFGTELSSSLFTENETLQQLQNSISEVLGVSEEVNTSEPMSTAFSRETHVDAVVQNAPHATSLLLQGSPESAEKALFMFPDGSGSASSYAGLARLGPKVAVYGLNCPWRTDPEGMAKSGCTISKLSAKFVMELRYRQPHGPYNLGGWSAGGICAFEAARQLAEAGQVVDNLILIDSPNPVGLQNPPARMYDFFQELGIFGMGNDVPQWLRPHFDAFIRMLDDHKTVHWPDGVGKAPKTLIIYARDGVCKDPTESRPEIRPDDPREMIWLLNNRTDFSANGWASLIGCERLSVKVLSDVNHFSMMDRGPQMKKMCEFIMRAIV